MLRDHYTQVHGPMHTHSLIPLFHLIPRHTTDSFARPNFIFWYDVMCVCMRTRHYMWWTLNDADVIFSFLFFYSLALALTAQRAHTHTHNKLLKLDAKSRKFYALKLAVECVLDWWLMVHVVGLRKIIWIHKNWNKLLLLFSLRQIRCDVNDVRQSVSRIRDGDAFCSCISSFS